MKSVNKLKIEVRRKGVRFGEPGELIETIFRKPWCEAIGNFNPMFCRYHGKRELVSSKIGDLSDPFRRTEEYLKTLYIEVTKEINSAAVKGGRIGGASKSARKIAASKRNGLLGGRPRKTPL